MPASPGSDNKKEVRTISLVKGPHTFCLRYEVGSEQLVLDSLAEMVKKRDVPFDWFDAAVLSHQLGQHLSKEMQALLPKKEA
ncbi:MAG TPA: hypothetical protein PK402_08300 [Tepidisphaeraceae bacterium]|nr:hypothetical protein [Tepidisphaeraceae bacterium]